MLKIKRCSNNIPSMEMLNKSSFREKWGGVILTAPGKIVPADPLPQANWGNLPYFGNWTGVESQNIEYVKMLKRSKC